MTNSIASRHGFTVRDNELWIEDLPVSAIAKAAGTPVYIYSERKLTEMMTAFENNFKSDQFATRTVFASKAFNVVEMLRLAAKCGLGLDVVSAGELYTAKAAGFPMEKVVFHGNNKSEEELRMAYEYGVGTIVLDNLPEARHLAALALEYPEASVSALLRVNPGVEAHTHEFIVTAHPDSKFGVLASQMDQIIEIASVFDDVPQVSFDGFHAHIGSQIFEKKAFVSEIGIMSKAMAEFEKQTGRTLKTLDLGGGFAVWYTMEDKPVDIAEMCQTIVGACQEEFAANNLKIENVWIEPGRSIVGNAGVTVYEIGMLKKTPHKTYAFIDGGMHDNIRPALYQAEYSSDLALKMDQEKTEVYAIAGKCCESGDIIIQKALLPKAEPGDLLVTYSTGAYGYSMASHYNKNKIPPVVFVSGDQARFVVKPESWQDIIAREVSERII
ncbi:MAG: diaminopimelate decarboxylase [Erysipelotrichaceae bacterium]|nr:diaminopimelate decarboxylase [Erysipelotrichaceae bacterium]